MKHQLFGLNITDEFRRALDEVEVMQGKGKFLDTNVAASTGVVSLVEAACESGLQLAFLGILAASVLSRHDEHGIKSRKRVGRSAELVEFHNGNKLVFVESRTHKGGRAVLIITRTEWCLTDHEHVDMYVQEPPRPTPKAEA